jgi:predicted PhzF superfamily epimerase YddE/YHI9
VDNGRLWHVDAFATAPFAGNPAAVLLLDREPDDELAARAGAELNQPATAVVWPGDRPGWFGLRWFTAIRELELCGHGTLAAARVLLDSGAGVDGRICFETPAGTLEARAVGEWVQLRLPSLPPQPLIDAAAADGEPGAAADGEAVLGEAVRQLLDVPVSEIMRNDLDVVAVLSCAADVRRAAPDLAALSRLPVRGLVITAAGDDGGGRNGSGPGGTVPGAEASDGAAPDGAVPDGAADFVSRFFSPATGVGEDAVTGSAHCALGPYWIGKLGRQPLLGRQLSARGGVVQVAGDGDSVLLAGPALVLSEGSWRLPAGTHPGQPVPPG